MVEHSTASWSFYFGLLLNYEKKINSTEVNKDYETQDGYKLGSWVSTQRKNKKNNQITPERIAKLDKLGFIWDAIAIKKN